MTLRRRDWRRPGSELTLDLTKRALSLMPNAIAKLRAAQRLFALPLIAQSGSRATARHEPRGERLHPRRKRRSS
jgi:hypothetical protein